MLLSKRKMTSGGRHTELKDVSRWPWRVAWTNSHVFKSSEFYCTSTSETAKWWRGSLVSWGGRIVRSSNRLMIYISDKERLAICSIITVMNLGRVKNSKIVEKKMRKTFHCENSLLFMHIFLFSHIFEIITLSTCKNEVLSYSHILNRQVFIDFCHSPTTLWAWNLTLSGALLALQTKSITSRDGLGAAEGVDYSWQSGTMIIPGILPASELRTPECHRGTSNCVPPHRRQAPAATS